MASAGKPGVTTFGTPTETEVSITRIVNAPRALVFAAFTDPQHVPNWLTGPDGWTMPVCEIDLRPGGAWRYVYRKSDGAEMTMGGSYREVTPPERVVSTESWGSGWPDTVNTMVLTESAGQTTISITVTYPTKAARDAALKSGMKEGMNQGFAKLDKLLKKIS